MQEERHNDSPSYASGKEPTRSLRKTPLASALSAALISSKADEASILRLPPDFQGQSSPIPHFPRTSDDTSDLPSRDKPWDTLVAELRSLVAELATHPDPALLSRIESSVAALTTLATDLLAREVGRKVFEKARETLEKARACPCATGTVTKRLLDECDSFFANPPPKLDLALVAQLTDAIDAQVVKATDAAVRYGNLKRAAEIALDANDNDQALDLVGERKRVAGEVESASAAIVEALEQLVGATNCSPAKGRLPQSGMDSGSHGVCVTVEVPTQPPGTQESDSARDDIVRAADPGEADALVPAAEASSLLAVATRDELAPNTTAALVTGAPFITSDSVVSAAEPPNPEPAAPIPRRQASAVTPILEPEPSPGVAADERASRKLITYDAFCASRWIAPDGTCQQAPWTRPDFDERVRTKSSTALAELQLAHMEIFGRALEARAQIPVIAGEDVHALADICSQPTSDSSGSTEAPRLPRIRTALKQGAGATHVLATVILELLKPSDAAPPTAEDHRQILDTAAIGSQEMRTLVDKLLQFRQQGEDGWSALRLKCRGQDLITDGEVLEQLRSAREHFQQRVAMLWSAAAGKVQRTHCREAWSEFVKTHVEPLLTKLVPTTDPNDFTRWDRAALSVQVRRLPSRHAMIADRKGAKMSDRRAMDKAAAEIADLASQIIELVQTHANLANTLNFHGIGLPVQELRRLLDTGPLADPGEEFCRLALNALVRRQPTVQTVGLTAEDRWRFPDLLPLLAAREDTAQKRWEAVIPVGAISPSDIVRAAAVLLDSGDASTVPVDMPRALRVRLIETDRADLLPYLVGSEEFDQSEKTRIQREQGKRVDALKQQVDALKALRRECMALSLPNASQIELAYEQALDLQNDPERMHRELPVIHGWLGEMISSLSAERARNVVRLRVEADGLADADQRAAILAAIEAGRFERALASLRNGETPPGPESMRQTLWRRDAQQRFGDPRAYLSADVLAEELGELPRLWLRPATDARVSGQLRRAFYDFVSGEGDLSATRKRLIVPKELREIRPAQVIINCAELLRLLGQEGLNPSFAPQLREFSEIVIMSAPQGVTPTNAPNQLSRSIAAEEGRKLIVFLWPGLAEPARDRILAEMRGRMLHSGSGAILDDLDLCRLIGLSPFERPHGMLGLIELIFEQVSWRDLSPYVSRDGQFIQMEMFVGRRREADKLARTAEYTRVFSGRKLGKSALLRYVEQTYSGETLPSGNQLQVLYIIVAGGESEPWLTNRIVDEVRNRFPDAPPVQGTPDPGDRLALFLEDFFRCYATVNLLVILDEADTFVEGQLRQYDQVRERSLSFRMMKETFGGVDRSGLPRVRFVFSGYRVTNTRAGAWANAGGILRLTPLSEEDSVTLVEGPLGRLGIDARKQAVTIARYCGFQPAIIIRFCDTLLRQIQLRHPSGGRRDVEIDYDDVVNTFTQASVQEEIRTINDNNFQGNRVGRIVFWTMLLAYNDLLSGQGLENAPDVLLRRIKGIDLDTGWLRKLDPSETGEILRNLHDFRDRELIEEKVQPTGAVYRMKFPAHLPVLMTEEDPEHQIRQDIRRVRESGHEAHFVTTLLTPAQIDDLRFAMSAEGRELGFPMAIAASPWTAALQDSRGGVLDRLGYWDNEIVDAAALREPLDVDGLDLLVHNATAAIASEVLARRSGKRKASLLVGGTDLLRWAIERTRALDGIAPFYVGLRRLDEARLAWWYERKRNINFDMRDAMKRIADMTSGVPLLVGAWDQLIAPQQQDVSREQFGSLCDQFTSLVPTLSRELAAGAPVMRLKDREIELLKMLARAGKANNKVFDLREELVDNWTVLYEGDLPGAMPLYAHPCDAVAIDVLIETGLLPVDGSWMVRLDADDAVYRLVAAMD